MRDAILEVDKLLLEQQHRDQLIVLDGAVDVDRYLLAAPRVLWILREPNGNPGDLREYYREDLFTYPRWQATAGLMIRVAYGLLNRRMPWGHWADDARAIADCLRDVAIINVNKRGGGSRVDWRRLGQASQEFGEILCQQVAALDPQIVILGGTWGILPSQIKTQLDDLETSGSNAARIADTSYVRAYHPNQTTISHEQYYNRVCESLAKLDPMGPATSR